MNTSPVTDAEVDAACLAGRFHNTRSSRADVRKILEGFAAARAPVAQPASVQIPLLVPLLAKPHTGMRVDYRGLLRQSCDALRRTKEAALAEMLFQLQGHLTELGQRWYAGDVAAVDEILQLYCVEKDARDLLSAAPTPPKGEPS